jgi:hypothetical protein
MRHGRRFGKQTTCDVAPSMLYNSYVHGSSSNSGANTFVTDVLVTELRCRLPDGTLPT